MQEKDDTIVGIFYKAAEKDQETIRMKTNEILEGFLAKYNQIHHQFKPDLIQVFKNGSPVPEEMLNKVSGFSTDIENYLQ